MNFNHSEEILASLNCLFERLHQVGGENFGSHLQFVFVASDAQYVNQIGTQIFGTEKSLKSKTDHSVINEPTQLPAPLATDEAMILWQKAQEAGLDADILQEDDDGPKMVMTDLVPLFREVCDKFEAPNDKTIKLSFFPIVDHLEIMANRQQMQQLLQILLENAANFSPNKSKVKVFVEKHQGKGILRVVDSGIGLPNDVRPHLFEQIVGDDDNPRLHMVFDIVLSHGGTVRAEDNPGGGTVFIIEFPCDPEEEVIEEAVIIEDE